MYYMQVTKRGFNRFWIRVPSDAIVFFYRKELSTTPKETPTFRTLKLYVLEKQAQLREHFLVRSILYLSMKIKKMDSTVQSQ